MVIRCKRNISDIVAAVDASMDENFHIVELIQQRNNETSMTQYYQQYHVDNDFDLIEAIYKEDCDTTGNLWSGQWFKDLRMKCAMNPEYTEKCLNSPAFWDMKDIILEQIKHA